ncbi:MAG TPA: Sir2 family NAD-dependent protein deacetylase [Candidatus Limnocylindrales bacterium]|nr:Sir2 family NAD-dependent protein deacetylase [Candidatus Limnocylindrales bacterium]
MEQTSKTERVFVLTGAGISAESGIPTFQGTNWRGRSHYELANIDAWNAGPALVWDYYSERRRRARDAQPNAAHFALGEFEQSRGSGTFFLCTQNVDNLHEAAGSRNLVHIHGQVFQTRCAEDCGRPGFHDTKDYQSEDLPRCECGALQRPDVVWFGEQPYGLDRVFRELEACDVFVAVGTSGNVQPVAGFVAQLKSGKKSVRTIFVGLEEPTNAGYFDEIYLGPATVKLTEALKHL